MRGLSIRLKNRLKGCGCVSYDIYLKDRVSGKTIELPTKHIMTGGTYRADYDEKTGLFSPQPISEAWLNVTYNYAHYYYEATEGGPRFAHDEISAYYADGTTGPVKTEYGIRGIYGKTGAESLPLFDDMIARIEAKYKVNGKWISTDRERRRYLDAKTHKELDFWNDVMNKKMPEGSYIVEKYTVSVNEGPNSDYWEATAANAIKPLIQLKTMASLRPDGVWDGD